MKLRIAPASVLGVCALLWIAPAITQAMTAAAAPAASDAAGDAAGDAGLSRLADDYFDHFYFPTNPTAATTAGIHRYDSELEDYSRAGVQQQIRALHAYERRFEKIEASALTEPARADRELLLSSLRGSLLMLATIRPWQKNPDSYSSGIAASAFTIMERNFASPNERLRLLIERERHMPAALRARFSGVNGRLIAALKSYQQWLQTQVLPCSQGDFRLGAKTYSAKLLYDEMVDTPLPRLLDIGTADLRRNQAEFSRVARELEPDKSAQQVLAELAADHPEPRALLDSFRATFGGLIGCINARHIITIPSSVRPILQETPPCMRATTFASMDTPGPYESVAQQACFNVTLPDPDWDKQHTEGFMAQFNYPVISNVAVHEAYPGHDIQFLWMHRIDDRVRKLIGANSNAEGWAHYCEQMMLDEGYQSREVGEVETKRGSSDPTYLYYTLGKLQILKLRAILQAREGGDFKLEQFHDAFMQQGFPPIKLVRRALLHDDSPTL
jgi:hypothetical protein